jgi:uncharacterized OB-fold protein
MSQLTPEQEAAHALESGSPRSDLSEKARLVYDWLARRGHAVAKDSDRPFYDAANRGKLVLQYCTADDRWQYPPEPVCAQCGSADHLEWRENDGDGTILSNTVVRDTPTAASQAGPPSDFPGLSPNTAVIHTAASQVGQPVNLAVISLDHAPGINFLSHLPGSAPGDVPIGGKVKLTFEATQANGQNVPEWTVVK